MNNFLSVIKLLKLKHHIKNIVVFIPLIFSLKFLDLKLVALSLVAFLSFSLIASAVYIFNDIFDVEKDRLHPIKKTRPIASGEITIPFAWSLFALMILFSFALSLVINKYVFIMVLAYLILNICYTYKLKAMPIVDVVCIALGFILRVLAGCAAILVLPSPLVILLTFFTSMFFTYSKRKLEYSLIENSENCRKSIREYNEPLLNQYVTINAILSIAFYFTYMLDETTIKRAGTEYLYITVIPFAILIYRLLFLVHTCSNNDDPANFIYKDKTTKVIMFIYFVTLALVFLIH